MTLVQAVNTGQVQARVDDFAERFIALAEQAKQLSKWGVANLTTANASALMVVGYDEKAMTPTILAELQTRLAAIGTFSAWAEAGNPSPLDYLRSVKRTV